METQKTYSCPMHPEVTSDKPGKCSKCGMNLVEEKEQKFFKQSDASKYSKTAINEIANKPFSPKAAVGIVSVYDRMFLKNIRRQMGVPRK